MKATSQDVAKTIPKVPSSRLVGHDGPVQAVVFTDDGKYCLTGGHDRVVKLWNPFRYDPAYKQNASEKPSLLPPPALPIQTYTSGYTHPISAVLATETRTATQVLLAASKNTLVVSDLMSQKLMRRFQGHVGSINAVASAQNAEAYLTASYDGSVAIWDGRSSDFKPIQQLKDAKDSVTDVHVVQTNDSSNNSLQGATALIRTASIDGCVRTYDLRKGVMQVDDCGAAVTSMAPTKDGECLAVSCLDGTIRLLQIDTTGELLNTFAKHKAGNYSLDVAVLADDSTVMSASEDGTCVLYDLVRAHVVQELVVSDKRPTCTIAANPRHSSVVVTASYDESAIVWSHDSSLFYGD
eukprot:Nitzschia sp. Nitz4//scaffold13_size275219//119336//120479//NITZ4_000868-RA/size275219-augustus-gene-0.262-mRNA-1//-1//CDS//3329535996//8842//frame0